MVLWDTSPPSSWSTGFLNKVTILCPNNPSLNLLSYYTASHMNLGLNNPAIVNKAEIDVFLELSCFFDDPLDVGNLISGSSAFSKTSLNVWKSMVHILLKPGLENFEH